MLFCAQALGKSFRIVNTMLCHQLLQLGRAGFSGRLRLLENRWWFWSDRIPLVKFLSKEVSFESQKNLSTFYLSQVEALSVGLFVSCHDGITIRHHVRPESLPVIDDFVKDLFLIWLKREVWDLLLPSLEVFQLWSCSITRNLDTPIAYGTSVFLVILYLASCDLQTLSMIPNGLLVCS